MPAPSAFALKPTTGGVQLTSLNSRAGPVVVCYAELYAVASKQLVVWEVNVVE